MLFGFAALRQVAITLFSLAFRSMFRYDIPFQLRHDDGCRSSLCHADWLFPSDRL